MGEGTLYPALKRLEQKWLLTSYWGETDKAGRRKYFSITEQGKSELKKKLDNWRVINDLIDNCIREDEAVDMAIHNFGDSKNIKNLFLFNI